jgi:hypothetical protein
MANFGSAFYLNAGLAYLLLPRIQLDVFGGISAKDGHRYAQVCAGFSWFVF